LLICGAMFEYRFFIPIERPYLEPLHLVIKNFFPHVSLDSVEAILCSESEYRRLDSRVDVYFALEPSGLTDQASVGLKLRGEKKKAEIKVRKNVVPGHKGCLEKWKKHDLKMKAQTLSEAAWEHLVKAGHLPIQSQPAALSSQVSIEKRRLHTSVDGCLVNLDMLCIPTGEEAQPPKRYLSMSIEAESPVRVQQLAASAGVSGALQLLENVECADGGGSGRLVCGGYPSFVLFLLSQKK
jgi:hypothetical protein